MADPNPQLEHGFTAIAHEILEALARYDNITRMELQAILLLLRRSYGFKRDWATMPIDIMMNILGWTKTRCSQIMCSIEAKKIVTVPQNRNGLVKKYRFNKHYGQWAKGSARPELPQERDGSVKMNEPFRFRGKTVPLDRNPDTLLDHKDKENYMKTRAENGGVGGTVFEIMNLLGRTEAFSKISQLTVETWAINIRDENKLRFAVSWAISKFESSDEIIEAPLKWLNAHILNGYWKKAYQTNEGCEPEAPEPPQEFNEEEYRAKCKAEVAEARQWRSRREEAERLAKSKS